MTSIVQYSRAHLETLKVAELKTFCKESKITGYSKLKRSELIERICQATSRPGTTVSKTLSTSLSRNATQISPTALQTPGQSFAVPNTPSLADTPSTVQTTLLATPSETQSPTLNSGTDPAVAAQLFAKDGCTSSPSFGYHRDLLSVQSDNVAPAKNIRQSYYTSAGNSSTGSQRTFTATDAAVSLKDVVQKQREKKRKADESLPSTTALQKGKKKVARPDGSNAKKNALQAPLRPALANALQLSDMTPATLGDTTQTTTGALDGHEFTFPTQPLATAAVYTFESPSGSFNTASQSASLTSRPSTASNVTSRVILSRNQVLACGSEVTGLTTGYNLALPSTRSTPSVPQPKRSNMTSSSQASVGNPSVTKEAAKMGEAEPEASVAATNPGKKTTTPVFKPLRRGNPKMAPILKSVIPQEDAIFQSKAATSATPFSLPRIPPGTAPLSTSEHIKIGRRKNTGGLKVGNISKFTAPAPNQHSGSSTMPQTLLPSLSDEEPLLFKHGHTSSTIINAKSTARLELTARMKKSWLYRFHQQLANARSDAMNQSPNTSGGSRSPTGLPGMSAEFVCSATTTSEQFNVAITFVIARIHTLIQGDDWIGLIKEEDVEEVTMIGGGVWEVSTRLKVLDGVGGNIGGPSAFKTRKCIFTVIGETGEVIGRSEASGSQLRADWRSYIAAVQNDATVSLLDHLKTKDDTSYPHGIAAGWSVKAKTDPRLEEEYHMAERYVLSNVMPNSCSGDYRSSLQMDTMWIGQGNTTVQPRRPKVNLYLPESHQVESVSFVARGSLGDRPLHPSVSTIKRKTAEDFVLRQTGQVIGNAEDSGIAMVWQCLLGCEASGVALPTVKAKGITAQFWTGLSDNMADL
ncbi:hypothetical protein QFC21_005684 [Naganishia friedmannii]|uniref:Uncharacterized protein n=1 Tax=Naganishia friedmannii TaxID=89922 RepID=A0ACC2V7I0_9TREE|nr:hypothetical protein QFC21_005684 [Naganishia friedmannii]